MKKIVTLLIYLFIININCDGQESSKKESFLRNSITIIPASNKETSQFNKSLIKSLNNFGSTGRYDYNIISNNEIKQFQNYIEKSNLFDLQDEKNPKPISDSLINVELINIIRKSVLDGIIKTSTNTDSANARLKRSARRIVTSSALTKGDATADFDQMIVIMNNSYIGIEILQSVKNDKENVNAVGVYYWYKLEVDYSVWVDGKVNSDRVKIEFVKSEKASAIGVDDKDNKYLPKDLKGTAVKVPKEEKAVNSFVEGVLQMALTMDQFKLKAVVQSTVGNYKLDIGNREDIYLDLGFKVYQPTIVSGKTENKYVGFLRIEEVGDNNANMENMSTAYGIIAGNIDEGSIANSHDQLFDIYIRPNLRLVNIPAGVANWLFTKPMMDADATSSLNLDLGAFFNIAKFTKVKQLFAGINVSVGFPTVKTSPSTGSSFSINPPMTIEANLAVMKKFWFSRFNVSTELDFGVNTFSLSGKSGELVWDVNSGMSYGLGAIVGLEYAINPDINFGLDAGYRYVLSSSEIVVKVGDKETKYPKDINENFFKNNGYNDLNLGGLRLGLRFSYSIPPLF